MSEAYLSLHRYLTELHFRSCLSFRDLAPRQPRLSFIVSKSGCQLRFLCLPICRFQRVRSPSEARLKISEQWNGAGAPALSCSSSCPTLPISFSREPYSKHRRRSQRIRLAQAAGKWSPITSKRWSGRTDKHGFQTIWRLAKKSFARRDPTGDP